MMMTASQLLFLLVSVVVVLVEVDLVDAWNCGSEFGDVSSRTVRAVAVFEGRAKRRLSPRSSDDSGGDGGGAGGGDDPAAQVVFRVERVLKGNLEGVWRTNSSNSNSSSIRGSLIAVGFFGNREDPGRCTGSLESVEVGALYIVFVGNRTSSSSSSSFKAGGQSTTSSGQQWSMLSRKRQIPSFMISGRPELTSPEVIRVVQSYNCSNCAREPKSRLLTTKVSIDIGEKLQLHCRTVGQPSSVVTWFKDGTPLVHDRRRQIRHSKRSSRLRIKEMGGMDFGVYQCIARNVLGISNVSSCIVSVRTHEVPTEKPHAVQCAEHSYCLNGGLCFILTPLKITFCQCKIGFEGERCEEKHTGINAVRAFAETPTTETALAGDVKSFDLIALAAGALLMTVVLWLCIVALAVERRCRKQPWHQRKAAAAMSAASTSFVSRGWVADDNNVLTLIQPNQDLLQYNLFPSGAKKRTAVPSHPSPSAAAAAAGTSAMSDSCASDEQCANEDIPKRLSASSLFQFLVPTSFNHRRQRLQAVSESFDCDE